MNDRHHAMALQSITVAFALCLASCTKSADGSNESDIVRSDIDFSAFEQTLFSGTSNTEGAVVQYHGRVVYERYAAGYDQSKRHLCYSVSKSLGSALLGVAVAAGLMALDDSVCKYVPAPVGADPTFCDTTIQNLVQMTSGLEWNENYDNPLVSNVLPMLYGHESDMGLYVARQQRGKPAGSSWQYSTGDTNLLARALRGALGSSDMRAWAKQQLLDPVGMSASLVESDASGTLVLGAGAFMTPRDMARFGQLYLDGGMVGATRVLPARWVEFTKTPAPPVSTPRPQTGDALDERGGSYGASFWLNAATPDAPENTLMYAGAPRDTFCAQGNWGQRICIVPSRDLVIVRVGNDRRGYYDVGPALVAAVAAVDSKAAVK